MKRIIINYKFVVKKVKSPDVLNGRRDFLVTIIELLRFLIRTYCCRNHHAMFEIDRTILT